MGRNPGAAAAGPLLGAAAAYYFPAHSKSDAPLEAPPPGLVVARAHESRRFCVDFKCARLAIMTLEELIVSFLLRLHLSDCTSASLGLGLVIELPSGGPRSLVIGDFDIGRG
jgi:hypothetical protein